MSAPLVSVVITSWNAGQYLPQTLASALGQTWSRLEVIVVDDGSTDDTGDAIAAFMPRIRYERRSHQGLAAARNAGLRLARGDYVALLDADDLWRPEKIATQVEIAQRHPETGLVVCNGVEFAEEGVLGDRLLSESFLRAIEASPDGEVTLDVQRDLIARCGISCPAQVLIPRPVLQACGLFAGSGAQDYDFYLRVARSYPVTLHHHRHVQYRYRADSMSGPREWRQIRWNLDMLPVLLAHRGRCRAEYRHLLDARIRELAAALGYGLMKRGRASGRMAATVDLLEVLRAQPWPPRSLAYLAALWTPEPVYRLGVRLSRGLRGVR